MFEYFISIALKIRELSETENVTLLSKVLYHNQQELKENGETLR